MSTLHHHTADTARRLWDYIWKWIKAEYPGILRGVEKLLHQTQYLLRLERAHNHKSCNFSSFVNDIQAILALCSSCVIYLSSFKSGKATGLLWEIKWMDMRSTYSPFLILTFCPMTSNCLEVGMKGLTDSWSLKTFQWSLWGGEDRAAVLGMNHPSLKSWWWNINEFITML